MSYLLLGNKISKAKKQKLPRFNHEQYLTWKNLSKAKNQKLPGFNFESSLTWKKNFQGKKIKATPVQS